MKKLSFGRRVLLEAGGFAAVVLSLSVGAFRIPALRAQQAASPLEFDAVSVKPSNPNSSQGMVVDVTPGGDASRSQCHAQRLDRDRIRRPEFSD